MTGAELIDATVRFVLVVVELVEFSSPTALIMAPMSIMNNSSIRLGVIALALLTCAVEFPVVTVVVRTLLVFAIGCVVVVALELLKLLSAVTPRMAVAKTTQNKQTFAHIASTR